MTPRNWPDETDPAWWLNRLRVRARLIAQKEARGEVTEFLREDIGVVAQKAVDAGTPLTSVEEILSEFDK